MVITELIKDQVFEAAIMFGAGIGLAALYQVWHLLGNCIFKNERKQDTKKDENEEHDNNKEKKQKRREKRIIIGKAFFEIIFWLIAAFFTMKYLYYAAFGDISFHNFFALLLGALLWRKIFYDMII